MSTPRILQAGHIRRSKPTGGVSCYCQMLLESALEDSDTQVRVYMPPSASPFPLQHPRLKQTTCTGPTSLDTLRLRSFRPTLFQAGYYEASPLPGLPTVQIAYDFIDRRFPMFMSNTPEFRERQNQLLLGADAVLAISDCTRNDLQEFCQIPDQRIQVVRPTIREPFRNEPPSREVCDSFRDDVTGGAPYLFWVGPGLGYKNRITFIRAFVELAKRSPIHLVIAGQRQAALGELELDLLLKHHLWDRVHLVGAVSDTKLHLLYAASEGLVFASLWEGFGIPVVEALASGTRLYLSDTEIFREVAGESAQYADPLDVDAWISMLENGLSESSQPDELHARRNAVLEKFHPRQNHATLRDLYTSF